MAYREAIRDCDEALKLDPKFGMYSHSLLTRFSQYQITNQY